MRRCMLDSTAWFRLAESDAKHRRALLLRAAAAGRFEVVLSMDGLKEHAPQFARDDPKASILKQLVHALVRQGPMLEWNFLLVSEIVLGRTLKDVELHLPELSDNWLAAWLAPEDWAKVAYETKTEKDEFWQKWRAASSERNMKLSRTYSLQQEHAYIEEVLCNMRYLSKIFCEESWKEIARESESRRHLHDVIRRLGLEVVDDSEAAWTIRLSTALQCYGSLIMNESYFAYQYALSLLQRFGVEAYDKNDEYDTRLFAQARVARCKVLVSDDRKLERISNRLRKTLANVPIVLTLDEFTDRIR